MTGLPAAFFEPVGERRFAATDITRGPWDPGAQHAGPPAALLGRAVERAPGGEDKQVGRITFEILRPVPVGTLDVDVTVIRPGRKVDLIEAVLTANGQEVMRARAWRLQWASVTLPFAPDRFPPPDGPEAGEATPFFDIPQLDQPGYHTGMEWRFLRGGFREPGPAVVWLRMRVPLLPGEAPSPLIRVLIAADSGNGVSARLDPRRYLFINTDLTVHLHRPPSGEWICLDARTVLNGTSVGLAETGLADRDGYFGRGLQTLLVAAQA